MMNLITPTSNEISIINKAVLEYPEQFVSSCVQGYFAQVNAAADYLAGHFDNCRVVLLGGASGSGKTTTAKYIAESLKRHGLAGEIISLDNFYYGLEIAPKLPDGTYDYESVDALNLHELNRCIKEMLRDGTTMLPQFDFVSGRPSEEKIKTDIDDYDIIIFEGIHAQNPRLKRKVNGGKAINLFVSVEQGCCENGEEILSPRDIRLMRRLVRDKKYRNSDFDNTYKMWKQVIASEEKNIMPFKDKADIIINTYHAFEAPLIKEYFIEGAQGNHHPTTERLFKAMEKFETLPSEMVPRDCLLHEFIG